VLRFCGAAVLPLKTFLGLLESVEFIESTSAAVLQLCRAAVLLFCGAVVC
jgi:hypothetical protein